MKLTRVLCNRNNNYRMVRRHWYLQGKKVLYEMKAEQILKDHGIEVVPIHSVIYPKPPPRKLEVIGMYERPIPRNHNHPDYKHNPCFIYKDNDVLVEALNQAKALTNTVQISESLPENLKYLEENLAVPDELHEEFKNKVMSSCLFEATQEKLPKRKNPEKPMWVFPRDYGIPEEKKCNLVRLHLINLIENYWRQKERSHIQNVSFSLPFNAFNKLLKFELTSELSITSKNPINAISDPDITKDFDLPDLYPLDPTLGLRSYNFYDVNESYPIDLKAKWPYVHTSMVHYNSETVQNVHGEPVKEEQIISRGLLKGFCIAGSLARDEFGYEVEELPKPIVTQVIQTNGQWFHYSIFQLNTLVLDRHSAVKNIFWSHPRIWLYSSCSYLNGRPTLVDYNPEVLNKFMTFYKNE